MGDSDKKDLLLTSLEEIKSGSAEDVPPAEVAIPITPKPAADPAYGLLDSLLCEVKQEADREIEEITRTMEEKTEGERKAAEEEERQRREQYEKLIKEEARKRLAQIRRKEDEKRRRELEEQRRENARIEAARQEVRSKKTQRVMAILGGVAAVLGAALAALAFTGVITFDVTQEEARVAVPPEPRFPGIPEEKKAAKAVEEAPIEDPAPVPEPAGIDGSAAPILALPEKVDLDRYRPAVTERVEVAVVVSPERFASRLDKIFSSGGHVSSGSSGQETGLVIDTSVFSTDPKKKKKK